MPERIFVSIIVPVYKVEKYIDKCIKSILDQTYKNYELILVDDGSPDKCSAICDEYASKYKFIHTLHKQNGGLSDARNAGIAIANGEFVTFVDSDDYISEDYLEKLVRLKKMYDADLCVGGLCTFYENEKPISNQIGTEHSYSGLEALKNMLYQNGLDTSACAMLLPKRIAEEYPFPVGQYHEDEFTTYKYYAAVDKVAVTTKSLYFYLQRQDSIMHTFGQQSMDELDAADNLVKACEKNWPEFVKAAKAKKFSDYCQVYLTYPNIKEEDKFNYIRIKDFLSETKWQILRDPNTRIKNKIAAFGMLFGLRGLACLNSLYKVFIK